MWYYTSKHKMKYKNMRPLSWLGRCISQDINLLFPEIVRWDAKMLLLRETDATILELTSLLSGKLMSKVRN